MVKDYLEKFGGSIWRPFLPPSLCHLFATECQIGVSKVVLGLKVFICCYCAKIFELDIMLLLIDFAMRSRSGFE